MFRCFMELSALIGPFSVAVLIHPLLSEAQNHLIFSLKAGRVLLSSPIKGNHVAEKAFLFSFSLKRHIESTENLL